MTEHAQLIADCEARESRLNDWERTFIDSLSNRMAEGGSLTAKQVERLEEVWERVTAKG